VLSEAAVSGDVIQIYTLKNFRVPNTYTIGQTDDQFLTKTSASSTYLTQSSASTTYAPVAAGGLVLINSTSFTAQSTVSLNDVFSATYDFYVIKLGITANTAATDSVINFRLRVSGSDASTNYITQRIFNTSTTVTGQQDPTGTDRWYWVESSATHPHAYATMEVFNPFIAAVTTGTAHTSFRANTGSTYMNLSSFRNTNATSYTGFSLINSTGNITGLVSVFGVKK
jgi:hypothetical protein